MPASVIQDGDDSIFTFLQQPIKKVTKSSYTDEETHSLGIILLELFVDGHEYECMRELLLGFLFRIKQKVKLTSNNTDTFQSLVGMGRNLGRTWNFKGFRLTSLSISVLLDMTA